jgi:hypothetical protein
MLNQFISDCAALDRLRRRADVRIEAAPEAVRGEVADGRLRKYFGSSNGWPISLEPTTLPPRA